LHHPEKNLIVEIIVFFLEVRRNKILIKETIIQSRIGAPQSHNLGLEFTIYM